MVGWLDRCRLARQIVAGGMRTEAVRAWWLHHPQCSVDVCGRAEGTGLERLTTSPAVEWAPAWSPDETQIAFTLARYAHGSEDVALLTLGSPVVVRFVISHSLELEPDWRPVLPA